MGVSVTVALVCLGGALSLLWLQRADLQYAYSSRTPLTLGSEGAYDWGQLQPNRYVQVHGVPTPRGVYGEEHGVTTVVVGLRDTPLLVHRAALPGEEWVPGKRPPPPNQSPFAVRGRLVTEGEASRYAEAFKTLRSSDELRPKDGALFLILEGERPGADVGVHLIAGGLVIFALVNLWLLVRALRHRVETLTAS